MTSWSATTVEGVERRKAEVRLAMALAADGRKGQSFEVTMRQTSVRLKDCVQGVQIGQKGCTNRSILG